MKTSRTKLVARIATAFLAGMMALAFTGCGGKKDGGSGGSSSAKAGKSSKVKAAAGLEMVAVPAAEYELPDNADWSPCANGGTDSDARKSLGMEKNLAVQVQAFQIAKTETTYGEWYEVLKWATDEARGDNRYRFKNPGREGSGKGDPIDKKDGAAPTADSKHPVTCVSWADAAVWCNALSEKAGLEPVYYFDGAVARDSTKIVDLGTKTDGYKFASLEDVRAAIPLLSRFTADTGKNGYRLPTAAEWYLAAKGGKPGSYDWDSAFSGGDTATEVAWFRSECGYDTSIKKMNEFLPNYGTKPVAGKKANALGLYDMSGNVNEWLQDVYIKDYFEMYFWVWGCVNAGGSWWGANSEINRAVNTHDISSTYSSCGFRVARNAQ